jgi:hypothetical protein
MPGADGMPVAVEVRTFRLAFRRDKALGSSAGIDDDQCQCRAIVAGTGNRELTLQFQGKTQKVAVPENARLRARFPAAAATSPPRIRTVAQGATTKA